MSENLSKNGVCIGVLAMAGIGMILTWGASNLFLSAGFDLNFPFLLFVIYCAGVVVWLVCEFVILTGYSWEWQVRLGIVGAIVLTAGIVLNFIAQAIT